MKNERAGDKRDEARERVVNFIEVLDKVYTTGHPDRLLTTGAATELRLSDLRALVAHPTPAVSLEGAPRELWLAKGRLSGQWNHHAFREPTVKGWQRYVREDLVAPSATLRITPEVRELLRLLDGKANP